MWTTDDDGWWRTDYGPLVYYKLTLWAFGSDELKTLLCITVGVQAIWSKNSTSVISEIHKIENKKLHIKWLLCAKYYTKIYRSLGLSVFRCISIKGWTRPWCPIVTHWETTILLALWLIQYLRGISSSVSRDVNWQTTILLALRLIQYLRGISSSVSREVNCEITILLALRLIQYLRGISSSVSRDVKCETTILLALWLIQYLRGYF